MHREVMMIKREELTRYVFGSNLTISQHLTHLQNVLLPHHPHQDNPLNPLKLSTDLKYWLFLSAESALREKNIKGVWCEKHVNNADCFMACKFSKIKFMYCSRKFRKIRQGYSCTSIWFWARTGQVLGFFTGIIWLSVEKIIFNNLRFSC